MRIGFLGLGVQGKHLALNLVAAGHEVTVYDPRPEPIAELVEAGAKAAASARDVGATAEITAVCVRDDDQARDAVLGEAGLLAGMPRGAILVVHSTLSNSAVKALYAAAQARGVEFVDAPVSGGESGAKARTMSYMVGGDQPVVDRCAPLFAASGEKVTFTGGVGTGMQAKIVHQLIICVNMMAASEGLRMGRAAGLSDEVLTKVVREGGAQSRMADNYFNLSLRPHAVDVFDKDLKLCLEMAADLGMPAPAAALAKQRIDEIVP